MKKILSLVLAVLMVMSLATAFAEEEVPTVKWAAVGSGMPANYDAWKAAVDAYIEPIIGCHLDYECVSWGDWSDRSALIINSGEPIDIIFDAGAGNLATRANLGAYQPLDALLAENGADLIELIPADYWDAAKVNGEIYGIPTYKDSSQTEYSLWDTGLLEETGMTEIAANAHELEDIEPVLYAFKEYKEADGSTFYPMVLAGELNGFIYRYDNFGGVAALAVRYNDEEAKVVKVFEQDDMMANLKLLNKWYNDGIINPDAATLTESPAYNAYTMAQGWSTAALTSWANGHGDKGCTAIQYGETILTNDTVLGSVNCISVNSDNPDKAVALLNLVNTDTKFRDMLYYGLEGDNFEYTADGRVHKLNTDWTLAGYTQGTFFNVSLQDTDVVDQWAEVKELNANANPSVLLGFVFDPSPVEDELANLREVYNKYGAELKTGTMDPETIVADMYAEMEAAGLQTFVDEAQAQINAFLGK